MSRAKKPLCPMCNSHIEMSAISFSGSGTSSSTMMGGKVSKTRYICRANFDICSVSISIFNSVMEKNNLHDRVIDRGRDWRDALKRYNHYIDFMTDHQSVKERIMLLADDELRIRSDWSFLIDQ